MKFEPILNGAYFIELDMHKDERGHFARTFCKTQFKEKGLNTDFEQCSLSFNHVKGTLRGMHYQKIPYGETKLVRCTRGEIYDVIIDLRPESPTFKKWKGFFLSERNSHLLYIPEGFAHGFQTLKDNTEVFYQIQTPYVAEYAAGVRWNDPVFAITWPSEIHVISSRDQNYMDFA